MTPASASKTRRPSSIGRFRQRAKAIDGYTPLATSRVLLAHCQLARQARRRWSEDEKRALVAETFVDGVARRHNISRSMLFDWRKSQTLDKELGFLANEAKQKAA